MSQGTRHLPPRMGRDVASRLVLGGYGPLAVVLVTLALLVAFTPSVTPKTSVVTSAAAPGESSASGAVTAGGAPEAGGALASGGASTKSGLGKVVAASTCAGGTRQTREPFSPPCISFSGNNGGATSRGVTADSITVTIRVGDLPTIYAVAGQVASKANIHDTEDDIERTIRAYFDYFNTKFQLYGRKAKLVFFKGQGDQLSEFFGGGGEAANADALKVSQEIKAFADLSVLTEPYADALVRQKVMALPPEGFSAAWYRQHAPYAFGVLPDCTLNTNTMVDYAVTRLMNHPARYAGDPAMRTKTRAIGMIAPEEPWYQECARSASARFKAAGGGFAKEIAYTLDFNRLASFAANMVAQLKDAGVTTVACFCDPVLPLFLTTQATQQEYFPEWFVTGAGLTDADILGQIYDQKQWNHAFGISFLDDVYQGLRAESYRAYKAVRNDEPAFIHDVLYYPALMFFLGVQMAGPNLTPETFQQGMFAYPRTRGEAGTWGFGPNDYTATDDAREIWFDPTATSPFNGEKGRYIATLNGNRFTSNWPAGEATFPIQP